MYNQSVTLRGVVDLNWGLNQPLNIRHVVSNTLGCVKIKWAYKCRIMNYRLCHGRKCYRHPKRNISFVIAWGSNHHAQSTHWSIRARSEPGGTRWRTGGEVKEKLANGVGSQYSHATSKRGLSSITQADAHTSAASSRLNWRPHRFKWTRTFGERRNLVSAHVPSGSARAIPRPF